MISSELTITSIVEDTTYRHGLWAIHGISFFIESSRYKILFDIGESHKVLLHNLKILKIDLHQINCLITSHGHIDHIGGLAGLLPHLSNQPIYILENALNEYVDSHFYDYSRLPLFSELYKPERIKPKILSYKNLKKVNKPVRIYPNFWLTGPLLDKKGVKEQALIISLPRGLVVIIGCNHPGIKNTIDKAQKITNKKKIYAIIGGFHLKKANKKEISDSINYLKTLNPEILAPCHCTGLRAVQMIKDVFGEKVKSSILGSFSVGDKIKL